MLDKLQKAAAGPPRRGQNVSIEVTTEQRTRHTNKTGWNTKRYDAWMARLIDDGTITVATSHPLGTAEARRSANLKHEGGPVAARETMLTSVRDWIQGRISTGTVTAAHVRAMGQQLKRGSVQGVDAALVIVAAEGEITIENKVRGDGGATRDWAQDAVKWARRQRWLTAAQAQTTLASARQHIVDVELHAAVCVELGSGWGGATEGLKEAFDEVVTLDKVQQHLGWGVRASPDLLQALMQPLALQPATLHLTLALRPTSAPTLGTAPMKPSTCTAAFPPRLALMSRTHCLLARTYALSVTLDTTLALN